LPESTAADAGNSQGCCRCRKFTGLLPVKEGMKSPKNATRRGYFTSRRKADILKNLGAGLSTTQIAQAVCGVPDILDPNCIDVLLLALTPASYSSNNTADTPGGYAFISLAQVGELGYKAAAVAAGGTLNQRQQHSLVGTGLQQQPQ
jgi:hypothetical protein